MRADVGDWIIRGIKDELYTCKPDIFDTTYEPAAPPNVGRAGQTAGAGDPQGGAAQ